MARRQPVARRRPSLETLAETARRAAYLALVEAHTDTDAWIINAWPMERLAGEEIPKHLHATVKNLRANLYSYIASLGAEWSPEDEDTIVLRGTAAEAAKALKALWLSLHLAQVTPAQLRDVPPEPRSLPEAQEIYAKALAVAEKASPVPFIVGDRLLEAAAALALAKGLAVPGDIEAYGVVRLVADLLYALSRVIR